MEDQNNNNDIEDRPYSVSSVNEVGIEVSDDDLRKLAEQFSKGREELQKKIDSLIFDMPTNSNRPNLLEGTKTNLLANKNDKNVKRGIPINLPQAKTLRELTVSSCVHKLSPDWRKAKFSFRGRESELTYGLYSEKNGSKGFILSVQANILKSMIIQSYSDSSQPQNRSDKVILRPSEIEKKIYLIEALSNILWTAGEKRQASVLLNKLSPCFSIDKENLKESFYVADGLTENLHIFEFDDFDLLRSFIKSNISQFQKPEGCLVFLYSLIMSRKFEKIKKDLQGHCLIGDMEDCRIALYNLVLNGVATPYLHNNAMYYTPEGESLLVPRVGLQARSEIGLLYWDSKEDDKKRTEVDSMLRVPRFPIWIAIMGKNQIALLFNTNLLLMCDWRFEKNFNLHFYSPLLKQQIENKINIDTREEYFDAKRLLQQKYQSLHFIDEEKEPEIEKIITTKWPGCEMAGTENLMALL